MPTYANTINNNEILAKRAECDYAGADIQQTYATKSEVTTGLSSKENSSNKAQTLDPSSTTDFPSSAATANYVNSSVATATANFLGNFTLTDLGLTYPATDAQIGAALDSYTWPVGVTPTNNDYTYVEIQDPQTTGIDDRVERFKFNGSNWVYEYTLNNSSFTSQEKAAIDSGIDSTKVAAYDTHIADTTIHVTSTDKTTWNGKQDAISDLNTIRTGADLGATAVQPGDLATVATSGDYDDLLNKPTIPAAQVQSDWTEADNTSVSYIQNKPSLATVATSGLYSDLSGTPSIPTATSDLQNDTGYITSADIPVTDVEVDGVSVVSGGVASITLPSVPVTDVTVNGTSVVSNGTAAVTVPTATSDLQNDSNFITLSDVPAQVQSDWTESDTNDPAYIAHKPTLAAVATSGDYGDLSNTPTINNVPAVTSSDDNKVLKASYTGGVGSYSWEAESGGTVTDVEVDGTSVVSGGVASITMPTELVPTVTSSDDGKVLKAAYSGGTGSYSWETESGGGGADWDAESGEPGYIENKPVPKTLVAGTNITISENSSTLTVSATCQNAQADWTETDPNEPAYIQHKPTLATVATSGDYSDLSNAPTIPTVDQTYDASSVNAQSGVAVASGISAAISAAVTPISVVSTLPASPDPNTLYVVTGA